MESKPSPSSQVKVVYADYDYKTREIRLKFGSAVIEQTGMATIQTGTFGTIKRRPGEYLLAEQFGHEWEMCMKQRAEEMAKKIVEEGGARKS